MGYNTSFYGTLSPVKPLTDEQRKKLQTFMGADCRDHPEWFDEEGNLEFLSYIDLELDEEYNDIMWNAGEDTTNMVEKINLILRNMRKEFPDFELEGSFECVGDEQGDLWGIEFKDGWAISIPYTLTKNSLDIQCPHCKKIFTHNLDK